MLRDGARHGNASFGGRGRLPLYTAPPEQERGSFPDTETLSYPNIDSCYTVRWEISPPHHVKESCPVGIGAIRESCPVGIGAIRPNRIPAPPARPSRRGQHVGTRTRASCHRTPKNRQQTKRGPGAQFLSLGTGPGCSGAQFLSLGTGPGCSGSHLLSLATGPGYLCPRCHAHTRQQRWSGQRRVWDWPCCQPS